MAARFAAGGRLLHRLALLPLAATLPALLTACGGTQADPCALSSAGAPWLAFASRRAGNYDLFLARDDGSCLRPVTSDAGNDLAPTWSPDRKLAFSSDRGGGLRVWVHDLVAGTEAPLEVGMLASTAPAWSPDGASIAFEGRVHGQTTSDLYLVPAAGGVAVNLTNDAHLNSGADWSPDGKTLYFVSTRTGRYEVHALKPADCVPGETCAAPALTSRSRIVGKPIASRDGLSIVYARTVAGSSDTEVVVQALASGEVRVVSGPGDSEPALDPTGARLALRSYRYGNPELVLVDLATGAELRRLTDDPASDGTPAYAPR